MNFLEGTLNFLFDEKCDICNKNKTNPICIDCLFHFEMLQKNRIDKYFDKNYCNHFWMYKYEDEIRELILKYKFNEESYLYRVFSKLILDNKKAMEYINSFDVIVPVPIHKKRLKERGYNQCELIVKEICKKNNSIIYMNKLLNKVKNNVSQSTIDGENRRDNVRGVYELNKKIFEKYDLDNKKILIFDDVYTTGNTVNECARIIRKIGNVTVGIFTLAKD